MEFKKHSHKSSHYNLLYCCSLFDRDLTERADLSQALEPLIASVWRYCERTGVYGKTLTLKVKYADFTQITRSRSASSLVNTNAVFSGIVLELLDSVLPLGQGVRLLGVCLSKLEKQETAMFGQLWLNVIV